MEQNTWGEAQHLKFSKVSYDKWADLQSGFALDDGATVDTESHPCKLRYFDYRYIRFIYHPGLDKLVLSSSWIDPSWNEPEYLLDGLSSDDVAVRQTVFGRNLIDVGEKSAGHILLDEVNVNFLLILFTQLIAL